MIQFLEENLKAFPAVNFYFLGTPMGGLITSREKRIFLLFWQIKKRASWQQQWLFLEEIVFEENFFFASCTISKCYFRSSHVTLKSKCRPGTRCRLNQLLQNIRFVSLENGLTQFCFSFFNYPCHACKRVFIFVRIHWQLRLLFWELFTFSAVCLPNQTVHTFT